MAVESRIAQLYVEMTARGVDAAKRIVSTAAAQMVEQAKKVREKFEQTFASITGAAKYAFAAGAGAIALFTRNAMQGTMEGERMSKVFEMLNRAIGNIFAPYIRIATEGIHKLAMAFYNLDPATKQTIAKVALVGTAIAGAIAMMPVIASTAASMVTIIGGAMSLLGTILMSPWLLAVGAVTAGVVAVVYLIGRMVGKSQDASDTITDANKSWLTSLLTGFQYVVKTVADGLNWLMARSAEASDWIGKQMAKYGEALGILPEGTLAEYQKMPPIQPMKIDTKSIDQFFEKVKRGTGQAEKELKGLWGIFQSMFQAARPDKGFTIKAEVGFESLSSTFDRLQQAFAKGDATNIAESQLAETKAIREQMNRFADRVTEALKNMKTAVVGP